jgi:MFS family permease
MSVLLHLLQFGDTVDMSQPFSYKPPRTPAASGPLTGSQFSHRHAAPPCSVSCSWIHSLVLLSICDLSRPQMSVITWTFAAYSATLSAFPLISGRVSDVYSARPLSRSAKRATLRCPPTNIMPRLLCSTCAHLNAPRSCSGYRIT